MAEFGIDMRSLIDAVDEPALIVEGATVRLANGAARELLGRNIEGRDVRLAIRHPEALERILSANSGDVEATGIGELGRSWRLFVRALDSGHVLVRLVDRSDAVSAERMRVDFVANASHELRTPLATVIGYAETLVDQADLPLDVRDKFAHTIRDEATRMLRIIEDLMSLSRIQADRFVEPDDVVDLGETIRVAVANASHLGPNGKCGFNVDLPENLSPVKGDSRQLLQVFDNLLSNAARYGCSKSNCAINISAQISRGFVTVTVTDYGPGIAREHIPRLTERFYTVDEARSRATGGTGLGLAIVKHIVERHRGALEIRSDVGTGTSVSVRIPISAWSTVITT